MLLLFIILFQWALVSGSSGGRKLVTLRLQVHASTNNRATGTLVDFQDHLCRIAHAGSPMQDRAWSNGSLPTTGVV